MRLAAAIIETRKLPDIHAIVFWRHLRYLPCGTDFYIFHGTENGEYIKSQFPDHPFKYIELPFAVITESIYNSILTSLDFWNNFKHEKVLIFQHDSRLLGPDIGEFLQYDYIGAPWKFQEHGGNGGLSLRSVSIMKKVIERFPYLQSQHGNEDIFFSNHISAVGANLAPRSVCSNFSCETIFQENTFGCHAIEKWLNYEEIEKIYSVLKNSINL